MATDTRQPCQAAIFKPEIKINMGVPNLQGYTHSSGHPAGCRRLQPPLSDPVLGFTMLGDGKVITQTIPLTELAAQIRKCS